jgi:predicted transcriptional regulator of viral defense system
MLFTKEHRAPIRRKSIPFLVMFCGMTTRQILWDVAVDQYGYVTTADARALGVQPVELGKLGARGGLVNISHGVYRFPQWPVSDKDHLMEAVLWTKDPAAVLSHDTALDVLDLCDINPDKVHVTIPKRRSGFRRTVMPGGYVIHCENLTGDQRGWWEQIPTVTAQTAIDQGIASGVRPDLIRQAIDTALGRGLIGRANAEARVGRLKEAYR